MKARRLIGRPANRRTLLMSDLPLLTAHADMNRTGFPGDSIGWEIMELWED